MSQVAYDLSSVRPNPYADKLKNGYYIRIYVPPENEREQAINELELTNEEFIRLKEFVAREEKRREAIA